MNWEIHQRSKTNYTSVNTKETLSRVWQWTSLKQMVRRLEVQRVNTPYTFLKSATEQGVKPPLQLSMCSWYWILLVNFPICLMFL